MIFRDRPDGQRVAHAPKVRLFMPHLMPRRSDALVFFEHKLDVAGMTDYIARWNADATRPPLGLFHILVAAAVRTLQERPRMNRFIAGRRLYQRQAIDISISVIKAKNDEARLTVVKQRFTGDEGLCAVRALVETIVANGRAPGETASEKEVSLVSRLPRWVIAALIRLQRLGDYWNLLPARLIENDPLYASAMVSNLGSIGIDSAFHHLYEHGTLPIFATMGRILPEVVADDQRQPVVRDILTLRYSFDERIADGYYAARTLERLNHYVQNPWLLERPEDVGPGAP